MSCVVAATKFKGIRVGLSRQIYRKMSSNIQHLDTDSGVKIAYEKISRDAAGAPTLVYVPGYGSGKDGDKAKYLKSVSEELNCSFLRYDPVGLGESTPRPFNEIEFKDWVQSARDVFTKLGDEKNILVGSSMGGWISLLLASDPQFKPKISGVLLIAPALNFFRKYYQVLLSGLPKDVVERIEKGEVYDHIDQYGYSRPIRKSFFDKTMEFELNGEIDIQVPVTILHGVQDESVPFKGSIDIVEQLKSKDVELTYLKSSTHRFQDPESLECLKDRVIKMLAKTSTKP